MLTAFALQPTFSDPSLLELSPPNTQAGEENEDEAAQLREATLASIPQLGRRGGGRKARMPSAELHHNLTSVGITAHVMLK